MFDVGGGELILILLAIVLLFGPKKLPELARSFGKGMAQLRRAQTEFQRNLNSLEDDITNTVNEVVQDQPAQPPTPFNTPSPDNAPTEKAHAETPTPFEGNDSTRSSEDVQAPPLAAIRIEPAQGTISREVERLTQRPANQS